MLKATRTKLGAVALAAAMLFASAGTADANILSRLFGPINNYLGGLQTAITSFSTTVQADPAGARITLATNVLQLRLQLFQGILGALAPPNGPSTPQ